MASPYLRPVLRSASVGLVALALASCTDEPATGVVPPPAGPSYAASGSKDTPVTTTIADDDVTIASSLQIRSDALGAYDNSNATSVLQPIGAWVLDSQNPPKATRRVYLEFSQPVAGSGPGGGDPVAVPSGLYLARAIARCNLLNTSFLAMAPGTSMPCPLHVAFNYSGSSYAVHMNPGASGSGETAPETDYATVTCVRPSSGTGPCTGWTITPSGAGGRNVARLIKYASSRGTTTPVSQGDFYFSFSIGVTNP